MSDSAASGSARTDFLRQIVAEHAESGLYGGRVVTRFPPEPNGYLHVGHAKSICLNFGIAEEFGGRCHLRFDDTNPETEDMEFVRAIQEDVRWLGFDWGEHLYFASDYFERMYECAETLIRRGLAYVDSSTEEEIREARGTVTEPGRPTPYRERSVEENLDLFRRMRAGEFPDGAHVLRAKIDLASPNMIMRDPVLYRIRHADHYRRGDAWCIYPLYDYAHCLEDAFEGVTHSFCTLEFENNREIYDWILDHVGFEEPRTHQYEFNRLELDYTVLSKRKLIRLVQEGHVDGWDDPRMPTLAGIRRRGVPPEALRLFCERVGVARTNSRVDVAKLDWAIREVLNPVAPRVMAVLDPLKVVITNVGEDETEVLDAPLFPQDVGREGTRSLPFGRELWIEREDFSDDPPPGYRRLVPGGEVRLRYGYVIRCDEVIRDEAGRVVELRCTRDAATRGGSTPDGRRVRGTIHWVAAHAALPAVVRLYDRLFLVPDPDDVPEGGDFTDHLNPDSLVVRAGAWVEPWVGEADPQAALQFERQGYVRRDPVEGRGATLVFNRIVPLKDGWKRPQGEASRRRPFSGEDTPARAPARRGRGTQGAASAPRVPEDPAAAGRYARYTGELGLAAEDAAVLAASEELSRLFEDALAVHPDAGAVAPWVVVELRGAVSDRVTDLPVGGAEVGKLAAMVAEGALTRRAAKDVLAVLVREGGDPASVVARLGLERVSDPGALRVVVAEVLEAWPDKVAEYRAGRGALLGLFIGEVMKKTRGAADPAAVRELLAEALRRPGEEET